MHEDPFVRTLRELENTLTASHIAFFPVWCCLPSDDVVELRRRISPEGFDFSFVPVRNDAGKITGVVHRDRLVGKNGAVNAHLVALAPG